MKTLRELVNDEEPGIAVIRGFLESAENQWELLPASGRRDHVLLQVQVTTRSTMGALAYETGGLLVDHGWLRFLGSGHPRLSRDLASWNEGRSNGFYLVADDAAGGFFAINGEAFGEDIGNIYYWSPDDIDWQSLEIGYTDFLKWSLTSRLAEFCRDLRWPGWEDDSGALGGDRCFSFYPFLWTREGSPEGSDRRPVPVAEVFGAKVEIVQQLGEADT